MSRSPGKIDLKKVRHLTVNTQALLIRASLYESTLVGKWENMSFYRFLNRVAFNLRSPHQFLLFDVTKKKAYRVVNANPAPDPLFAQALNECLAKLKDTQPRSALSLSSKDNFLSPFINKSLGYFFIPIRLTYCPSSGFSGQLIL